MQKQETTRIRASELKTTERFIMHGIEYMVVDILGGKIHYKAAMSKTINQMGAKCRKFVDKIICPG